MLCIVGEWLLCCLNIPAILVHNGVNDLLRQRLIVYLEVLQKISFHGLSFLRYAFLYGGRLPCGWHFYASHGKNGMKKAAIANSATTTLISLIVLAPAITPGAAVFFQTVHKFGCVLICGLLKGLFSVLVILEDGLGYCVPAYGIGTFHRHHLLKMGMEKLPATIGW